MGHLYNAGYKSGFHGNIFEFQSNDWGLKTTI